MSRSFFGIRIGKSKDKDKDGATKESRKKAAPADNLGLRVLYEPEDGDAKVDIVAVHGLGGSSTSTWTHENGVDWLRDLLPTKIPSARIMAYEYDAGVFTKARSQSSFTFAESLLPELKDLRPGDAKSRPLFFIAHSLGGIVVKKVLIIAKSRSTQYGDIWESTRHVMFFGTPHQGTTAVAGFIRRLGAALSSDGSVLRELELWSPQILETNRDFLTEIAPVMTITTFWEREKVNGVQVVDEGSARLNQTHEDVIGLDADHRTMCKFRDADDNKFVKTMRRLQAELAKIDEHPLNIRDERIKDLLKNSVALHFMESLGAVQFELEAERWIVKEYSLALKQELRQWIKPPSFDDNDFLKHHSKISSRHPESAQWIFTQDAFQSWETGQSRILWICGRPGCGKSVLASSVVERLRISSSTKPNSPLVVYAFSDKQDENKKTSASLLRTILWQIVASDQLSHHQKLDILYDCRRTSRGTESDRTGPNDGFAYTSDLLQAYAQKISMVIVVDGLDECHDPELLAEFVMRVNDMESCLMKVLVSSQKVSAVARHLSRCQTQIDMEDSHIRAQTETDIRQYIRTELFAKQRSLLTENIEEITNLLLSKAAGMFLWAAVAVPEVIAKVEMAPNDLDRVRESIGELPENMEATFVYLLNRILRPVTDLGPTANAQRRAKLLWILRWTFHAFRPFTLDELNEATAITSYSKDEGLQIDSIQTFDVSGLIDSLYPILYVSNNTIHLMHSTFRSFVLLPGDTNPSSEVIDLLGNQRFQSELALHCLVYLNRPCFKDFISLSSGSNATASFAFLPYAAANWVRHTLEDPTLNASLQRQLREFLSSNQAITWIERYIADDVGSLQELQSQVYNHLGYTSDSKWILTLLRDSVDERKELDPLSAKTKQMSTELGTLYSYHGMDLEAEVIFDELYHMEKQAPAPNSSNLFHPINNLALVKGRLYKVQEAKQLFEELLKLIKTPPHRSRPLEIVVLSNLASVNSRMGLYEKAREQFAQVLAQSQAENGERHRQTALGYNNLGHAYIALNRPEVAKENILQALRIYTKVDGKNSRGVILAMNNLASAEDALGNTKEALRLEKTVWELRQEQLGEDHPDTMAACNNYCSYLLSFDRAPEALVLLQKQVRMSEKLRGSMHPTTLLAQSNLAVTMTQAGSFVESLDLSQRIFKSREQTLGINHPETLLSMHNYADSLVSDYRLREARPLLKDCLRLTSAILGSFHTRTILVTRLMSTLCKRDVSTRLGDFMACRAIQLSRRSYPGDHPTILLSEIAYAKALSGSGKYDRAEVILNRVLRLARRASIEDYNIVLNARAILSANKRQQGHYQSAVDLADEILDRCEHDKHQGKSSEGWVLTALELKSLALGKLAKHTEALAFREQAHGAIVKRFGSASNLTQLSQCNLALCHLNLGAVEMANGLIAPPLGILLSNLGPKNALTGLPMNIQARCHCGLGQFEEAKALQLRAITARETLLGPEHLLTLTMKRDYAQILFLAGDPQGAEQAMRNALQGHQKFLRKNHPQTIECAQYLVEIRQTLPTGSTVNDAEESETVFPNEPTTIQDLDRTLSDAKDFLGDDDPIVLILQRDLALEYEKQDRKSDAIDLLEKTIQQQISVHSATHRETLVSLMEIVRMTGQKARIRAPEFSSALTSMIQTFSASVKDLDLFSKVLDCQPDFSVMEPGTGYTPLALAVYMNEPELVRCLLMAGADPNSVESDGKTCLHISVDAYLPDMVKLLLASRAEPNVLDRENRRTPLYFASAKGDIETARTLLQGGANPNFVESMPPLHAAAGFNHADVVELLLDHHAEMEALSVEGSTPLFNAITYGHLLVVRLLHKRGANFGARTNSGAPPLHLACSKGWKPIVSFLLGIEQNVNEVALSNGVTPLHTAAEEGHWEIMELLIQAGASLDSRTTDNKAWTPLVSAAFYGRVVVVENILKLPDQTPNVHCGSARGTPLHYAGLAGHAEVVAALLAAGAEIDACDSAGESAVVLAVLAGQTAILDLLLRAGASVEPEIFGKKALVKCLVHRRAEMIPKIVEAMFRQHPSTDLNSASFAGLLLLPLALVTLPTTVVQFLLEKGIDPNTVHTEEKVSPLHFAVQLRARDCIQPLLDHGAKQHLQDVFGRTAVDMVEESDLTVPMLDPNFRTPRAERVSKTKDVIVSFSRSALALLQAGPIKSTSEIRDKLQVIASGCLILNSLVDACVAFEQCIIWKQADSGERVMEHNLGCLQCRQLDDIVGVMYVCAKCPATALCAVCFEKHRVEETRCDMCRHGLESFLVIPRESSRVVDDDIVPDSQESGPWSLSRWLESLPSRIRALDSV